MKQQHPLAVFDEDGTLLGEYVADLFVDNRLLVELKAVKALKAVRAVADEHVAQILGYLKASRIEHGLLIHFGSYPYQNKKYVFSQPSGTAIGWAQSPMPLPSRE